MHFAMQWLSIEKLSSSDMFLTFWHKDCQPFYEETSTRPLCDKINRGAGYGLEVPCVYRLYGPKVYIDEGVDTLTAAGLL